MVILADAIDEPPTHVREIHAATLKSDEPLDVDPVLGAVEKQLEDGEILSGQDACRTPVERPLHHAPRRGVVQIDGVEEHIDGSVAHPRLYVRSLGRAVAALVAIESDACTLQDVQAPVDVFSSQEHVQVDVVSGAGRSGMPACSSASATLRAMSMTSGSGS